MERSDAARVDRPRFALWQTLDEARPTIERLLRSEVRRKRLDEFTEEFREKWRGRTECREGYVTSDCRNGPDTRRPHTAPLVAQPSLLVYVL